VFTKRYQLLPGGEVSEQTLESERWVQEGSSSCRECVALQQQMFHADSNLVAARTWLRKRSHVGVY
jgi:hypothetical protein